MKVKSLFFGYFFCFFFFWFNLGLCFDPCDLGQPDTVYFTPFSPHSENGETLYISCNVDSAFVIIDLNFWNDYGSQGFFIPLVDLCYYGSAKAYLDSAKNESCFAGSRVEDFDILSLNLEGDSVKSPIPPNFLAGGVDFTDSIPGGNGLLCRLKFTVEDTGSISLDTLHGFYPPIDGAYYSFTRPDAFTYYPVFQAKTFIIAYFPNNPPLVSAPGQDSGYVGDTIKYFFFASDPDSDVLLNEALAQSVPDCGVYSALRTTGAGTDTGTWEVTFDASGCDAGSYSLIVGVKDSCENTGYDTTVIDLKEVSGTAEQEKKNSFRFLLSQNYPNPFNLGTQILVELPKSCEVSLKIYNLVGQVVNTLVEGRMREGVWVLFWNGEDESGREVASGIYFIKLTTKDYVSTKKMLLIK